VKVTVITISDRASRGVYEDLSGPKIVEILREKLTDLETEIVVIPDEKPEIRRALEAAVGVDFIITTGGTGIGPRDLTPEVTAEFCDKELPGISEMIRWESYQETSMAMLSRGYSGMKGNTIVVNFPGSVKAVTLCTKVLLKVMGHAVKMLRGEGH